MEDAAAPAAAAPPVKGTVIPARLLPNGVQFSIHEVPRAFARELAMVLPDVAQAGLLIVPTFQKAAMDLVNVGPDVAKEKDDLLEKVRARPARWAPRADPCAEGFTCGRRVCMPVQEGHASKRCARGCVRFC